MSSSALTLYFSPNCNKTLPGILPLRVPRLLQSTAHQLRNTMPALSMRPAELPAWRASQPSKIVSRGNISVFPRQDLPGVPVSRSYKSSSELSLLGRALKREAMKGSGNVQARPLPMDQVDACSCQCHIQDISRNCVPRQVCAVFLSIEYKKSQKVVTTMPPFSCGAQAQQQ